MDNQIKQHVKELIVRSGDHKLTKLQTPIFFYVEPDLYFRFKICCYTQNIEPFQAIKDYMIKTSSPQTVELIKKILSRTENKFGR
jgi:hypothetical protein